MKLIVILLSSILISPIVKAGDSIDREIMRKQAEDTISIPIYNNGYTTPRSIKEDDEFITPNGLASWRNTSLLTKVSKITGIEENKLILERKNSEDKRIKDILLLPDLLKIE